MHQKKYSDFQMTVKVILSLLHFPEEKIQFIIEERLKAP